MEGATHYIEQWKTLDNETFVSKVLPIRMLEDSLMFTKLSELKTICIFKIKLKKP